MTGRLDHRRTKHRNRRTTSVVDEAEQMEHDGAARWLAKAEASRRANRPVVPERVAPEQPLSLKHLGTVAIRCACCGHAATVPCGESAGLAGKVLRCTRCGTRQRLALGQVIGAIYREHEGEER